MRVHIDNPAVPQALKDDFRRIAELNAKLDQFHLRYSQELLYLCIVITVIGFLRALFWKIDGYLFPLGAIALFAVGDWPRKKNRFYEEKHRIEKRWRDQGWSLHDGLFSTFVDKKEEK